MSEYDTFCVLCSENIAEIDFHAVVLRKDGKHLVRAPICFDCAGKYTDDLALANALITKANKNEQDRRKDTLKAKERLEAMRDEHNKKQ